MKGALAGGEKAHRSRSSWRTHAGHDHRRVRRRSSATGSRPRSTRAPSGPYTELVYQPMLELLAYLRANGFKTFIVSGGGIEFMRPWTEKVYGIPPEQVVGSSVKTKFEMRDGKPGADAAAGDRLHRRQGRASRSASTASSAGGRSLAFGNSDGDLQMLQWTAAGDGPRASGHRPPHRRRARVGLRPQVARSASSTRRSTRRRRRAGPSST